MKGFKVFIFFTIIAAIVAAIIYFKDKLKAVFNGIGQSSANDPNVQGSIPYTPAYQYVAPIPTTVPQPSYISFLTEEKLAEIRNNVQLSDEIKNNINDNIVINPIQAQIAPNGESIFEFYPQTNGQPYPDKPQGNGYVQIYLPSHPIVSTPVQETKQGAVAGFEYWLYNQKDNFLVVHCKDTQGGFHPNFFDFNQRGNGNFGWVDYWLVNFRPYGSFPNAQARSNNHLEAYNKHIMSGTYKLIMKNLGNTKITAKWGYIRASNGEGDVNVELTPGQQIERILNINPNGDEYDTYKGNANNISV